MGFFYHLILHAQNFITFQTKFYYICDQLLQQGEGREKERNIIYHLAFSLLLILFNFENPTIDTLNLGVYLLGPIKTYEFYIILSFFLNQKIYLFR